MQIWCMELVSKGLIFIEIFFQPLGDCKIVVHILLWKSLFWRLPVCSSSRVCVSFTGGFLASNGYILRAGMGFHRFGS